MTENPDQPIDRNLNEIKKGAFVAGIILLVATFLYHCPFGDDFLHVRRPGNTVHGIVTFVLLQGIWNVATAITLLRWPATTKQ